MQCFHIDVLIPHVNASESEGWYWHPGESKNVFFLNMKQKICQFILDIIMRDVAMNYRRLEAVFYRTNDDHYFKP